MTEPKELLPCPFCGGTARKVKHSAGVPGTTGYDRWHGVACAGCNACVGARDRRFRTSADAIAVWNTRTPQPTQAQAGAVPLTEVQIEAAAKKLAECMDYPWGHMPTIGREEMRIHARAVLEAAHGSPPPPPAA